jgi:hypothetical protein
VSAGDRAEEVRFRDWLRTLDAQPAEVDGAGGWNHRVVAGAWNYVTDPLPAAEAVAAEAGDDTDGW